MHYKSVSTVTSHISTK